MNSQLDQMLSWEQGDLGENEVVDLFQQLIDTGLVCHLQGCYGRQAMRLIEDGLCSMKKVVPSVQK